jgi:O-antigen biosynthesis protein
MRDNQTGDLTSGCLPLAAFRHLQPTAIGVVDLDQKITPRSPDGRAWCVGERDGLLLIRMHGEPLAVVHVDRDLSCVTDQELAADIWRSASTQIERHIECFRCARIPEVPDALIDGVHSPAVACCGSAPRSTDVSAAVIISTAGREEQLGRCIRSLLAQRRPELEVVVVDNRPATGEARSVVIPIAAADQRVRYVPEPRVGLSVARNRGIVETDAELVAFTDDDVVADPGWLEWLLTPLGEPKVMVSCGMVLPLELQTEAQKRFEQYAGFSKGMVRCSYDLRSGPVPGRLLYPFVNGVVGVGNNMAFRRSALLAAGGFDPALGAGSPTGSCEETWAFSQAILRGGCIVYEPRALCWHEHRKDGDALREQVFGYGVGLGAVLTKALASDPRFYLSAARSLPIALTQQLRRRSLPREEREAPGTVMARPKHLLRARRDGVARGPLRYAKGVVRARRLRLGDVIQGR